MDDERLADYLAGELHPDEQAAVEAELAGDAALRHRLARMRAADEALGALSTPAPRPGFEERLTAALEPEVERAIAGSSPPDTAAGDEPAAGDELAARRAHPRRGRPTWPLALGGVAAAVALLAVVGIGVSQLTSMRDDADSGRDDVAMDAETAPEAADGAGLAGGAAAEGPVLLASGRELDDEQLEELFDHPHLARLAGRGLSAEEGERLAATYQARFSEDETMEGFAATGDSGDGAGAEPSPATPDDLDDADEAEETDRDRERSRLERDEAGLDADARADVRRCLDTLLDGGSGLVPAYAELATYQGEEVVVFGLVTPGADGQRYERIELWVLARDDCQVRTFKPRDR